MKKTNQEKTKKIVVSVGLLAAGALAVAGICLRLYKEEPDNLIAEKEPAESAQIVLESPAPSPFPSPSPSPKPLAEEEPDTSSELVISTEAVPESKDEEQQAQPLQQEPEKTEDEKPAEPPTETTAAADNPNTPPENTEIPAQPVPQPESNPGTTQNGTVQDGKIYIDGFGWIDYNGGETNVVQGDDIYENGNTVGIMD